MMNKVLSSIVVFSMIVSVLGLSVPKNVIAATAYDQIVPLSLTVSSTISLACDNTVTMNAITGTGQSTISSANRAACTVITGNSGGYKLQWTASSTNMTSGSDVIGPYTPTSPTVPETWSVDAADSEWGAKVGFAGENGPYNSATWGAADTYAGGNWLQVNATAYDLFSTTTETDADGFVDYVYFGAEIGASKLQPTGAYTVNVMMTAITL